MKFIIFCFLLSQILLTPCYAKEPWEFKLTHETNQLTNRPFFLMTTGDVNKNGIKELIVADFGKYGDHMGVLQQGETNPALYKLFILEWESGKLKTKFKKEWDTESLPEFLDRRRYFLAHEAKQMVAWELGNRTVIETIPPYLGLEWDKGKYILHEQQGQFNVTPLIGSWVFTWISPSCYQGFSPVMTWPRECLVGIRDFSGDGKAEILTIEEKKKNNAQVFRVRKFEPGFPIEKELMIDPNLSFGWWSPGTKNLIDRFSWSVSNKLLMFSFSHRSEFSPEFSWYNFEFNQNEGYFLKKLPTKKSMSIDSYDLPDIYLRTTQKKDVQEYWGYYLGKAQDGGKIPLLRKVSLKKNHTGFIRDDIDFQHNTNFIGVGYFDLRDIDGDGLDEVILVEETGKRKFYTETVEYSNIKDYIRILKWDGKQYKTMWVSPPYTKRGTKFLIEDIKNTGKKQLVVMTSSGTIQIWERQ